MTKKTIPILISAGIILGIFGIIYLIATKTSAPKVPVQNNVPAPMSYIISINSFKENITGQLTTGGITTNLNSLEEADHYGLISFNSANDIMWFQCSQGFEITNFSSSTGNKTTKIDPQVNIELPDTTINTNNNLTVTCSKIK